MIHFEELWEKCENLHQNESANNAIIIDEILLKVNFYKVIDEKIELPIDEKQKAKSRLLGEILLSFTNLSLNDNINVFEALNTALQFHR